MEWTVDPTVDIAKGMRQTEAKAKQERYPGIKNYQEDDQLTVG